MSKPELTVRLKLHLNGGSKFSELHQDVFADGEPTGITIHTRTDGRPEYLITAKEIHAGDETLDLMEEGGPDPEEWILARIPPKPQLVRDDPEEGSP